VTAEERASRIADETRFWESSSDICKVCDAIAAAIREAEAAMRERCAKVADGKAVEFDAKAAASVERDEWESMALGASLTAEAIRAGEEPK